MAKADKADELIDNLMDYSVVNSNIRKYREKAGLTQEQLAEKCHISSKYLSRLENNYYKGHLHVYVQIATALNISLYDLLGKISDKEENFAKQIVFLTESMTYNQREALLESIELIKKYIF